MEAIGSAASAVFERSAPLEATLTVTGGPLDQLESPFKPSVSTAA